MTTAPPADYQAAAEAKWTELRKAAGHYFSPWNPRLTADMDAAARQDVRRQMMAWSVGWWAQRGVRVTCTPDPRDPDSFTICETL